MNQSLNSESISEISDLSTLIKNDDLFVHSLIEYSARVCYRSTARMGTAPNFIKGIMKKEHYDVTEHPTVTVKMHNVGYSPLLWRQNNRHVEISEIDSGGWLITGNLRVWRDLFKDGMAIQALPILQRIAPKVFYEFPLADIENFDIPKQNECDEIFPQEIGQARVTLLGYNVPDLSKDQVLQHGSATFLIEGISRACSHQIVRHRLASFSQESQRYVSKEKGGWDIIVPISIQEHKTMSKLAEFAWEYFQDVYEQFIAMGARKEDARFFLPNAVETRLVVSMGFSSWAHFCWLRALDKAAQWEIRQLGQSVLKDLYVIAPDVFQEHMDVYKEKFENE